jgi:hypothetical protein
MTFGQFYYKVIQVTVSTNGFYTFKSVGRNNMYGCLYQGSFNSNSPTLNLLIDNDNSSSNQQLSFGISLQSINYILVATTYSQNITGSFVIVVTGPARVNFS